MMDISQAARMIEWLDEERRRDKATIATLEERLAQQQETLELLQRRLGSMESDQTVMRSQYVSGDRQNDLVEQMRREMRQLLETAEASRLTAEREAERRQELVRENMLRAIRETTEKMTKLERQLGDLPGLQVERDRLVGVTAALQQRLDDLYKKLDEPERRITFLEEQRRQDARRLGELESELPEIQKQIDTVKPKTTLLEDLALRNERKIQEIHNTERERREQIQQFIDQQTLILQQRDQQINDLVKRFGDHDQAMQQNIERFEKWADAYRSMKQIIDDFERIGDRLERRINEVAEMQRLSEERFRQEWNDWRSDDQKRWKQFTLSNDEVWRSHDKEFERFIQRMTELEAALPPLLDSLNRIWNLERARAQMYRDRYQALLLEHDPSGGVKSTTTGTYPAVKPGNGITNGGTGVPPVNP